MLIGREEKGLNDSSSAKCFQGAGKSVNRWQGCLEEAIESGGAWDKLRKRQLLPYCS